MFAFWDSLDSISYLSTVSQIFGACIGFIILVLGFRLSHLQDKSERAKDQKLEQASSEVRSLQKQLEPRTISKIDQDNFVSFLQGAPKGPIKVSRSSDSNEVVVFMGQIKTMLTRAGYSVRGEHVLGGPPLLQNGKASNTGIVLVIASATSQPVYSAAIQQAFHLIGIPIDGLIKENDPGFVAPGELVIYITDKK